MKASHCRHACVVHDDALHDASATVTCKGAPNYTLHFAIAAARWCWMCCCVVQNQISASAGLSCSAHSLPYCCSTLAALLCDTTLPPSSTALCHLYHCSTLVLDALLCDALFKGTIKKGELYPTHIAKVRALHVRPVVQGGFCGPLKLHCSDKCGMLLSSGCCMISMLAGTWAAPPACQTPSCAGYSRKAASNGACCVHLIINHCCFSFAFPG